LELVGDDEHHDHEQGGKRADGEGEQHGGHGTYHRTQVGDEVEDRRQERDGGGKGHAEERQSEPDEHAEHRRDQELTPQVTPDGDVRLVRQLADDRVVLGRDEAPELRDEAGEVVEEVDAGQDDEDELERRRDDHAGTGVEQARALAYPAGDELREGLTELLERRHSVLPYPVADDTLRVHLVHAPGEQERDAVQPGDHPRLQVAEDARQVVEGVRQKVHETGGLGDDLPDEHRAERDQPDEEQVGDDDRPTSSEPQPLQERHERVQEVGE